MSTLEDVKAAEERVKQLLEALKRASAFDPGRLSDELKKATDDYAKAVRDLKTP